MAKIFYSLAGEGRGHAARVRALVERLKHRHEIVIFTSDDAYDFLAPLYSASSSVRVERIPGLRFHYSGGEIDLVKTAWAGLDYRWHLADLVAGLRRRMLAEERRSGNHRLRAGLPRAAQELGVPVLSIDHQHFLVAYELSSLPFDLRCYANMMAIAVNAYGIEPDRRSCRPSTGRRKSGYSDVIQIGPLLRPEVALATPADGDYLLCISARPRRHVLQAIRAAESKLDLRTGARPDEGCLKFRPIDQRRFVADLAGCRAVITAAGNQLLGEALYSASRSSPFPKPATTSSSSTPISSATWPGAISCRSPTSQPIASATSSTARTSTAARPVTRNSTAPRKHFP